jgi:hypothetical protein
MITRSGAGTHRVHIRKWMSRLFAPFRGLPAPSFDSWLDVLSVTVNRDLRPTAGLLASGSDAHGVPATAEYRARSFVVWVPSKVEVRIWCSSAIRNRQCHLSAGAKSITGSGRCAGVRRGVLARDLVADRRVGGRGQARARRRAFSRVHPASTFSAVVARAAGTPHAGQV